MSQAIQNQYNSAFSGNALVGKGAELDKQAFLMLMVTQFQYQDPLNPTEDKEFVAQLAQFTSMEQMMNMNKSMDGLVEAQNKQMIIGAASFIGKEVTAQGWGISVADGKVSTITYASDEDIASGAVSIFDSNRELVATVKLKPTAAGVHQFDYWDGKKTDGSIAPNGVYTITITAKDENGKSVLTDAQVSGTVDGVSTYEGEQFLRLSDGRVVSLSEVREIVEPKVLKPEEDKDKPTTPDTGGTGGTEGDGTGGTGGTEGEGGDTGGTEGEGGSGTGGEGGTEGEGA